MSGGKRVTHGWFGDPWHSAICYDEDGRLRTETRHPVPTDEYCLLCGTLIDADHSGVNLPIMIAPDDVRVGNVHKECLIRCVYGPPPGQAVERRTFRDEALIMWDLMRQSP